MARISRWGVFVAGGLSAPMFRAEPFQVHALREAATVLQAELARTAQQMPTAENKRTTKRKVGGCQINRPVGSVVCAAEDLGAGGWERVAR